AYNAHTPVVVLEKLATDSDADVRRIVADNAHTPVVVLEKLATDSDAAVRRMARLMIKIIKSLVLVLVLVLFGS
ncbi:MAG TPA: hypothetical protein VGE85_11370, partial [Terracidiphilus sp.]